MNDPRDIQAPLRVCSRRQFLSSAIALALLPLARPSRVDACSIHPSPAGTCVPNSWLDGGRLAVEGYTDQRSYLPGERVTLFMSSQARTRATVTIHRLGVQQDLVWSAPVWVQPNVIPADASEHGCRWERGEDGAMSFEVPATWQSGFYRITMRASSSGGRERDGEAFFVVRSMNPARQSRILLMLSTNTYCAYNNYGLAATSGLATTHGSFYDQGRVVSFHRPLPLGFLSPYDCGAGEAVSRQRRYAGWDKWEWPFVQWAEREGLALDYATNEDLERYPDLVSSYRLVLSVGHDEYWSEGMRTVLDRYIRAGGNVAFFSGNVCYRQVGMDLPNSRLTLEGAMDGRALWSHRQGSNRPENLLTGVSFCYRTIHPDPIP